MENIFLDGAFGTCLWAEAEKRGIEKTSTWRYNTEQPQLLSDIIKAYAAAGSDVIYSNTFVALKPFLEAEHLGGRLEETIRNGIRIVKDSADVKVAASFGCLDKMMEPYGDLTKQQVEDIYRQSIDIAFSEDPDFIILETFMDLNMLEIAAKVALETKIPVWCSMSFGPSHKSLLGNSVEEMIERLEPLGVSALGMNCNIGPEAACGVIDEFASKTKLPLLCKPNSADLSAEEFAKQMLPVFGKAKYIGACCGTNPQYIAELRKQGGAR